MFRPLLITCASLAAGLAASSRVQAQTNISGALSGTLAAGVYHCTGDISVAPSTTLTISAGAVIKFNVDQQFNVSGTLIVNGTPGNKVYFTDINDDTVGGDSNGNGGATLPAANWWRGLVFGANADASSLNNFEVRYGGRNGYSLIELDDTNLSLANGVLRNSQTTGLDLNNIGGHPSVSGCTFQNNGGAAIVGVGLDALPGFSNNSATGNGGNYAAVSNGTIGSNTTLGPSNGINGAIYLPAGLTVGTGKTLALQAGTVLKFGLDCVATIDGTLTCTGTSGNKVYFTDINDDSVGGDSNANGASSGAANWWRGIVLDPTASASSLTYAELRYGGRNGYAGVEIVSSNPTLNNVTVRDCYGAGIDLNNSVAFPTIANCSVQNCTSSAYRGVKIDALPGFTNNAASGNTNNLIEMVDGNVTLNTTITALNGINGVVYCAASIAVPTGKTLTLQAGTIFKQGLDTLVTVDGTLTCSGSSGSPVIFTDVNDDVGGDTNGAATPPSSNWWRGLVFDSTASASSIAYTEVRYGGRNGYAGVEVVGSNPSLSHATIRDCYTGGIDLNNSSAYPTVANCAVQNCGGYAIRGVRLDAVPGFSNNTATGNTNNLLEVANGTIASNTTIDATNGINGVLYASSNINVPAGLTLAFQANVIVKFGVDELVYVDGTLYATGTAGNNVIFTDINDDVGGDTNGNGNATLPAANWWRGIQFNSTADASALDFSEVRYGGRNGYAGIEILDADVAITRSIVRNCYTGGIDLNSTSAKPRINRCALQNNYQEAIRGVHIDAVPFITRNTATGNTYNEMLVTVGTPTADLFLPGGLGVNDAIVMGQSIYVPTGIRLRLGPNAVIKFNIDQQVTVDGALDVEGTPTRPVVLTDARDDLVGGDSNGDGGASLPTANWWRGVVINASAAASRIEQLEVRYCGRNGYFGVANSSPLTSLLHCRVNQSQSGGFVLIAAARADYLAAWNSGGPGVRLDSGGFDATHVTAQGCTIGIQKNGAAWTGSIVNSIAWGNTTNYSGVPAGQVRYSDGFVGGAGNINADPVFLNAPAGDLHLGLASPCVGTGDPSSPVDADGSSPDMGAYPALGAGAPTTYCAGKANSAGCVPFMAFGGFASVSSPDPFYVRSYSVLNNKNGLFYYGFNGPMSGPFQGGTKCVAPPTLRMPLLNSGGTPAGSDCSGLFQIDFNAYIDSHVDPLLIAGATVNVQCWYRDPAMPSATGLSDGLQFVVCN